MKFVTDAKNFVQSYTNKYTVGGLTVAGLTAGAAYFSPVAALTVPHVAGLGLLSLTAVAGSYALFLGAKAAYNYVFDIKTEEAKVENKDEAKVENKDEAKVENKDEAKVENKDEAKVENKDEVKADAQTPGFFSRNWTKLKGFFSKAKAVDAPKADEAPKAVEVAAPEAPKAVEVAAPEAPKAVEVAAPEAPKAVEVAAPKAVQEIKAVAKASPRRSPRLNPVAAPVAEAVIDVEQPAAITPALNKARRAAKVVDADAKNAIHNRPRRACANY